MGWTPDIETASVFSTLTVNGIIFVVLMLIFEFVRTLPSCSDLYYPKLKTAKGGNGEIVMPNEGYFKWATGVLCVSDDDVLEKIGMDGYVLLRFLRMCTIVGGKKIVPACLPNASPQYHEFYHLSIHALIPFPSH